MNTNILFNVCKILFLVAIGFVPVAKATLPPIPKGIVSTPAIETHGFPDQILNDTRIVGLDIGGHWDEIETTEGVYDWGDMDTELDKAEAHGKKVVFTIVAGGVTVPAWLLADPDVQTFTFIDTNPYHSTYGQELTMPVFWDPIFLAKKIALIQAAGAHFASRSSIVVVGAAFANSSTEDWNIPNGTNDIANWIAAGYTTDLMINAGEATIDATMAAFPNQYVTMGIGRGAGDLDPTSDYLAETIIDYATTTYGRFITAKYSLAATTSDPAVDDSNLFNWQVFFNACPTVATQMLWRVNNDSSYRMNGGVRGNPATILLNAVTIGTHYGTQYQEIYETDLEDSTLSSTISTAKTLLTASPAPPAAPSNLSATSGGPFVINLAWHDNANNELGYRVEYKIGSTGTYELLTTFGPNSTATTLTSLDEGTQYYYRVQGVNAGGFSAYSSEQSATTVLRAPKFLNLTALSSSRVRLNWTDKSDTESGFKIERSRTTDTNYTQIATVGANVTTYTDTGLSGSTTYYYRVRAYNSYTNSDYLGEKHVKTQ
jgi:hypothetical protein